MMWLGIFAGVFLLALAGTAYLMRGALRFGFSKKLYERNKILGILSSLWPLFLCLPFLAVGPVAFVIAFVHLFAIWALTDLVAIIIRKIRKKEKSKRYINGFVALALTAVYLTYSWVMAHTVLETNYSLTTEKSLGQDLLRIVTFADLHLSTTLDGDEFAEECKRINATNPDVVLIGGDFVDDDTSREDMIAACQALGTLKTKYGVYFILGNHDKGYFRRGTFTIDELYQKLAQNNVLVLTDDVVAINENVILVGRNDRSHRNRKSAEALMADIDDSKYVIMLDHQPNDYDAIAKAAPDLVISGHTHGGHIFPAGPIGLLMGANDAVYGIEKREDTSFIVTSGISGWAIPFKTFCISEFVVIDIETK